MKTFVQINKLSGCALDWAVAWSMGYTIRRNPPHLVKDIQKDPIYSVEVDNYGGNPAVLGWICTNRESVPSDIAEIGAFSPSTNQDQGGAIIDSMLIGTRTRAGYPDERWEAQGPSHTSSSSMNSGIGPTRLVAAMRYCVSRRSGNGGVEVPSELVV